MSIPEQRPCDRAQALTREGTLVDDFLISEGENSVHVLNALSPAAIPIGEEIARRVAEAQARLPRGHGDSGAEG